MRRKHTPGCPCCGCGTIRVTVGSCVYDVFTGQTTGTPTVGATVTIYDSVGAVVGSPCTTPSDGICEIDIPSAGTYDVVVEKSGVPTTIVRKVATCSVNNVSVPIGRAIRVGASTCRDAGFIEITATHTATGTVTVGVTPVTSPWTVELGVIGTGAHTLSAHSLLDGVRTGIGTGSHNYSAFSACIQNVSAIAIPNATGYQCYFGDCTPPPTGKTIYECAYPIAETLYLTDSAYGATTLAWATNVDGSGNNGWVGSKSVSYPACGIVPGGTTTLTYTLYQSEVPVLSGNPNLRIGWDATQTIVPCVNSDFCPPPTAVELDFAIPSGGTANKPYCDLGATFTITE